MIKRALLALAIGLLAVADLSCNVNDYCLNCGKGGDGGNDSNGDGNTDGNDGDGNTDGGGPCVPSGPEVCDGKDNDCNGLVDDGVLPGIGDLCSNQNGECAGGVQQCVSGVIKCSKHPTPEICDNKDNDCNNLTDEGNPGGGGKCGTDQGECTAGTLQCQLVGPNKGTIQCVGQIGPNPLGEQCNLLDDDCDNSFDEGLNNLGPCGVKTCVGGTNGGAICASSATCPGGTCMANVGDCLAGTFECIGGAQQCCGPGVNCPPAPTPSFETCDHHDNDCDGNVDEDFAIGADVNNCADCGSVCATPPKTCQGGTGINNNGTVCTMSATCTGGGLCIDTASPTCTAILPKPGTAPFGTCGFACKAGFHDIDGNMMTNGCEYACFSSGVEVCDGLDNDCDGLIDNGLGAAPNICSSLGACSVAGQVSVSCNGAAGWQCTYGSMVSTDPSHHTIVPETSCDNVDNDCNGKKDDNQPNLNQSCNNGAKGECGVTGVFACNPSNLNGPAVCDAGISPCTSKAAGNACSVVNQSGATVAGTCTTTAAGLVCTPTPGVESCNGKDDDCDNFVDNDATTAALGDFSAASSGLEWVDIGGGKQMMKFEASKPDASGTDSGSIVSNSCGGASTVATAPGGASEAGTTATFTTTQAHGLGVGRAVLITGVGVAGYNGTFKVKTVPSATTFTVTLPTSGLGTSGAGTVQPECPVCSSAGKMPWVNVTYPQAQAACQAVGGSLCSEKQWYQTCSVTQTASPPVLSGTGDLVEAEDFSGSASATDAQPETNCNFDNTDDDGDGFVNDGCPAHNAAETGTQCDAGNTLDDGDGRPNDGCPTQGSLRSWTATNTNGFSGTSAMQAAPNTGVNVPIAVANGQSPRLDYVVNFAAAATYHVWLRMYAASGNDDTVYVGFTTSPPATPTNTVTGTGAWTWVDAGAFAIPAAGARTFSIYMGDDGVVVDALYFVVGAGKPPANVWAYATNKTTYQSTVCNGHDYDATQDATLPTGTLGTGSLTSCYANVSATSHVYDMSGNVKEWTLARSTDHNPIRGGSSNNTDVGISCGLNFTLANDAFFFPNVGFRCCR